MVHRCSVCTPPLLEPLSFVTAELWVEWRWADVRRWQVAVGGVFMCRSKVVQSRAPAPAALPAPHSHPHAARSTSVSRLGPAIDWSEQEMWGLGPRQTDI